MNVFSSSSDRTKEGDTFLTVQWNKKGKRKPIKKTKNLERDCTESDKSTTYCDFSKRSGKSSMIWRCSNETARRTDSFRTSSMTITASLLLGNSARGIKIRLEEIRITSELPCLSASVSVTGQMSVWRKRSKNRCPLLDVIGPLASTV